MDQNDVQAMAASVDDAMRVRSEIDHDLDLAMANFTKAMEDVLLRRMTWEKVCRGCSQTAALQEVRSLNTRTIETLEFKLSDALFRASQRGKEVV